jgi:putative ABC transport system permease protein
MDRLWQDLRYSVRTLRTQPMFAVVAVLTLALGVGANAAIFSVCQAVLFKPLPYPEPDRLVMVWEPVTRTGTLGGFAPANFVDVRGQSKSFERLAALDPLRDFTLTGHGNSEHVVGAAVTSEFFSVLSTRMATGRNFLPEEDQPGRNSVILSYALWQRRFGGDQAAIGKSLTLNDSAFTIVGVLPQDFQLVSKAKDFEGRNRFDVWLPLGLNPQRLQRGTHPLRVFGRLRTGISVTEAQAELDVVAKTLEREYPATNTDRGIRIVPLSEQIATGMRTPLLTLLTAVGFVWLIACVNVVNLLLTRASARQKEMSVRVALGANRFRIGQQLVTESLVLASLAAVVGTGLAWWCLKVLVLQLPVDLPRIGEIGLNPQVLGFIGTISLIAGIVFGCAPLVQRVEASESLKQSRHTLTRGQAHTRNVLVVSQIALACVLLVGAGLVGQSLWRLLNVSPGFRADRVLTAEVSVIPRRYPDVRRIATFHRELLARVRNLPGVHSAGVGGYLPLGGAGNSWAPRIEGRAPLAPDDYIEYRPVTPGYIETLAVPLITGRHFTDADNAEAPAVAMINETAAKRYWPNESAIGRRLQIDAGPPWRTVVGIVGNVRHEGLDVDAKPELYLPFAQLPYPNMTMTLAVRTASEPLVLGTEVRGALAQIDPDLALTRVRTMDDVVYSSVGEPRIRAILLGAFALVALALASIGVYGVMNYIVSQRTREFGVRMALGATGGDLLRLILEHSARLIAIGLGVGLLGAVGLARLVRTLLYGVSPHDLLTLASVSILLAAVALLASYLPARRATLIDPTQALRME